MPSLRRGARASQAGGGAVATLEAPSGSGTKVPRRRYDPAWDDWNPPRRWPGVLLSCVVVLGFLGIVVWHFRPGPAPVHHNPGGAKQSELKGTFVIGGGGQDVLASFSGTTSRSNLQFVSHGGLLVLHATCTCLYNFDVTIDQGFDQPVDIPISATGNQNTALAVSLPTGHYQFQVIGSGKWQLQLIQPGPTLPTLHGTTPGSAFKYFSSGNTVLGPFSPTYNHLALAFLSNGRNTIDTHILTLAGTDVATPFFGFSPYLRATTEVILPDPYYLEINAVGFWQVEVRPTSK